MEKVIKWYKNSLERIVLFFSIILVVTLVVVYIPYVNIFLSPYIRLFLIFVFFYLLFPLPIKHFVVLALIVLFFTFIAVIFRINQLAIVLGELLYLFLIFILVDLIKGLAGKKE